MEASHKIHRPHIKVGKDAEEERSEFLKLFLYLQASQDLPQAGHDTFLMA